MSVGPSALGTILIQRLDAVMGNPMAAHANLISGARPDAVAQPGAPARTGQTENATEGDRRSTLDSSAVRENVQAVVRDAKLNTPLLTASSEQITSTQATASAPTTLGQTARTILALLAQYPDGVPSLTSKAPLWLPPAAPATQAPETAMAGNQPSASPAAGAAAKAELEAAALLMANHPKRAILPGTELQTVSHTAEPAPASLAQALRHVLQNSGLFYESHLADLAFGQRTIAQLKSEPQARLAPANAQTGTALPAHTTDEPPGSAAPSKTFAVTGVNAEAHLLVRQQLEVLAHQTLSWRGEAWPGTPMEWEVERQKGETADAGNNVQTWTTRLKLDLPCLGRVEVRLSLAGNQLGMQLLAPLADQMSASFDTLRERLFAAGLVLSHLSASATSSQPAPDPA